MVNKPKHTSALTTMTVLWSAWWVLLAVQALLFVFFFYRHKIEFYLQMHSSNKFTLLDYFLVRMCVIDIRGRSDICFFAVYFVKIHMLVFIVISIMFPFQSFRFVEISIYTNVVRTKCECLNFVF